MAQGSGPGDRPGVRVWTFIIKGGLPLHMQLQWKIGPSLYHNGRQSVWKMTGTTEEALAAETLLTGPLVGAKVQYLTEEEDNEMVALRHQGES